MNNNLVTIVPSLIVGGAIGAFITRKVLKAKYERMAKDEIEEVREYYKKKYEKLEQLLKEVDEEEQAPTDEEPNDKKEEEKEYGVIPYVISPDEFGELYDYDPVTLILYTDGVLAYEDGVKVTDVDDIVGVESLNTFGKYEDDTVYVRNEHMKCDYEIIRDESRYSDIFGNKSQQSEK